jgi:hypothetical protein
VKSSVFILGCLALEQAGIGGKQELRDLQVAELAGDMEAVLTFSPQDKTEAVGGNLSEQILNEGSPTMVTRELKRPLLVTTVGGNHVLKLHFSNHLDHAFSAGLHKALRIGFDYMVLI